MDQTEQGSGSTCPYCELPNLVKNGRGRRGAQVYRCADCRRSLTGSDRHAFLGSFLSAGSHWSGRALVSAVPAQLRRRGRVAGLGQAAVTGVAQAKGSNPWGERTLNASSYLILCFAF
jgi:DNA-directed RNA polymerase subunit RPC12/RpoP